MIRYSKAHWGFWTLTRWYGSAFPRALPFSLATAIATALLEIYVDENLKKNWLHPYPFQVFAFIAGFMIVFRCAACRTLGNVTGGHAVNRPFSFALMLSGLVRQIVISDLERSFDRFVAIFRLLV
jgi:hypothetical protein